MEPASFLNLDLELRSRIDLAPLATYLEDRAAVLHVGAANGEFRLTAEPSIGGHPTITPEMCTKDFLDLLESLPQDMGNLFRECHARIFDYGFDGGLMSSTLSVDLPSVQLARMLNL